MNIAKDKKNIQIREIAQFIKHNGEVSDKNIIDLKNNHTEEREKDFLTYFNYLLQTGYVKIISRKKTGYGLQGESEAYTLTELGQKLV